jgi:hypothetical protein
LPAVQAGEVLRIRCSKQSCQFVNVIPADPALAPWEARGGAKLLIVDDTQGAVLLAPPAAKASSHKLVLALAALLILVTTIAFPPVRQTIMFRAAVHEIRTTNDAVNAHRWCDRLVELGPKASSAAPMVWELHFRNFASGKPLTENYINSVLISIAPGYLAAKQPNLGSATPIAQLIDALRFPDYRSRKHAAKLLGERGSGARDAVEALSSLAGKPQDEASGVAIEALGRIGPAASSAVPALIQLLGASGAGRAAAANALIQIAPGDARVMSALDSAGIPYPTRQPNGR